MTPIERIVQWNHDAGLLGSGYNDFLESSFQIEEALEGFPNLPTLAAQVLCEDTASGYTSYTAKDISRGIVALAGPNTDNPFTALSDVDRLDKALDAIIYAVGSAAKLGLSADQITNALHIVMDANCHKLTCPKDEYGKLLKDPNFIGPEPLLQSILDERQEVV